MRRVCLHISWTGQPPVASAAKEVSIAMHGGSATCSLSYRYVSGSKVTLA